MISYLLVIQLLFVGQFPVQLVLPAGPSLEACQALGEAISFQQKVEGTVTEAKHFCQLVRGA
jgi:hypothetical protein